MKHTTIALGVSLMFLAACGGSSVSPLNPNPDAAGPDGGLPNDPGAALDAGSTPGESEAVTVDGIYSVPVTDASLEPFASQPVVLDWRDSNGEYRLDYDFPAELTGVSQRVAFEGVRAPGGTIQLTGALGSASCEPSSSGAELVCTERFTQMAFDLERLERDLQRRGLSAGDVERRLEVAAFFQSDPIGILSFSLD